MISQEWFFEHVPCRLSLVDYIHCRCSRFVNVEEVDRLVVSPREGIHP